LIYAEAVMPMNSRSRDAGLMEYLVAARLGAGGQHGDVLANDVQGTGASARVTTSGVLISLS